jgi:hypothetical protein
VRRSSILNPAQKIEFASNEYFRDPDFKTQMEAKLLDEAPEVPEVPLCGLTGWVIVRLDYCMRLSKDLYTHLMQIRIHRIDPADSAKSVIRSLHLRMLTVKIQTSINKLDSVKGLIIGLPMSPNRLGAIAAAITHMQVIMGQYGAWVPKTISGSEWVWPVRIIEDMRALGASVNSVECWRPTHPIFNGIHAVLVAMRELEQSRLDLEASTRENAMAAYEDVAREIKPLDEP